jgi:3-deoxy-manno-octulosonate cytidylyltransferase (CMP-KDO synthetase)
MKIVALIPARYAASRFPGKLMKILADKPVIVHTYLNTLATGLFDDVIVVTDSEEIFSVIKKAGGKAMISSKEHVSGTDRIAEISENIDADVFINVQGDEPFIYKDALNSLCSIFSDPSTSVGSLMHRIEKKEADNPNAVKVVTDLEGNALYFSRSIIPYLRDEDVSVTYYKHIGVYGYRKETLLYISKLEPTKLEIAEKLEQLRIIENGIKIKLAEIKEWSVAIDTPEDFERAKLLFDRKTN